MFPRSILFSTALLLVGTALPTLAQEQTSSAMEGVKRVRIAYENLTTGQTFSPSVFVSHDESEPPLFAEGEAASFGIMRLAEEGNPAPIADQAVQKISGSVGSVFIALPIGPGGTRALEIDVDADHPLISGAWMLGHTNDGFTGVNAIDAFNSAEPQSIDIMAWDAGTENNNETKPHLIALMGTDRDPEQGVVAPHQGIRGDADAPDEWKFDPSMPVARITIKPVEPMATGSLPMEPAQ
jgi:hypothetical protein